MLSYYCCEEIGNPVNKWIDCTPCEKVKLMCQSNTDKKQCELSSNFCEWSSQANKCVCKTNAPPFAKSVKDCLATFSNNTLCVLPSSEPQTNQDNTIINVNTYKNTWWDNVKDDLHLWAPWLILLIFLVIMYLLLKPNNKTTAIVTNTA
ncbi:putative orfan [Tupanvirus soda lake]|uniref:Orfan n=2 Tax=Tupanvirus TaxID=2094720 RepID=A0AC62ADX5_9VIRU|nr:putative orfan [Tupanvirus soda lake]QKU35956.1 putative orfan [Tupanvirus soda lake]